MNEAHLAPETGMEPYAISYRKGCYIGQEIISRIRTYGQTSKILRRFQWTPTTATFPPSGARILSPEGKEIGALTSIWQSPGSQYRQALGYIRKEYKEPGTQVLLENQTSIKVLPLQNEISDAIH